MKCIFWLIIKLIWRSLNRALFSSASTGYDVMDAIIVVTFIVVLVAGKNNIRFNRFLFKSLS